MTSFNTVFRRRMFRFFCGVFASLIFALNASFYLFANIQYSREIKRQETSLVSMVTHLATYENQSVLLVYLEHYTHTNSVRISYFDASGTMLFQSEALPATSELVPIYGTDNVLLGNINIDFRDSSLGAEFSLGFIIINATSLVLFFGGLVLLKRYLDKQYGLLSSDMAKIGTSDAVFLFQDIESINAKYVKAINYETELKTIQEHYVRVVAHDIKTPLTVLKVYLEAMQNGRLNYSPEINKDMMEELNQIELLIPRFIETDFKQVAIKQNISPIIETHLMNFAEVFKTKKMTVETKTEKLEVLISPDDLLHLVDHLVFNAFYYSKPEGKITVIVDGDSRSMTVEDTGLGMSDETIRNILRGPYRAEETKNYNQKGSGVGYQIILEIVKRIKAKIEIQSNLGIGTKVTITFI